MRCNCKVNISAPIIRILLAIFHVEVLTLQYQKNCKTMTKEPHDTAGPRTSGEEAGQTPAVQPDAAPAAVPHQATGTGAPLQSDEELAITARAIELLRTVFDPEIPVNVYDLGLIYRIEYTPSDKTLHVDMTLTAPGCPAADFIMEDVRQKLMSVPGPEAVDLRLVFDPVWDQDMMSEEAKLELGFL